ncbi:MAG: nucleotide sugar dehydrogenase [Acidimicrobiales bacterium]|jgi:nucleotide sugar dehydrogenase
MTTQIGFIGQGWIGRHYADEFESRMYDVIRYSLEEPYVQNKEHITGCEVVFIAVPTPTTKDGFDDSIIRDALKLIGKGKTAVIKSTLIPGTTEKLQTEFPDIFVLHSPEFLVEATAAQDAAKPNRNLVGIPIDTPEYRQKAVSVLRILPEAPYQKVMKAKDAELVKYAGNCFLYTKVMFMNLLHDLTEASGGEWKALHEAMINDPRIGDSHTQVVHKDGRGAGGHCLIKDFEAFRRIYKTEVPDDFGDEVLLSMVKMNNNLLMSSDKDLDLLQGVYGDEIEITD